MSHHPHAVPVDAPPTVDELLPRTNLELPADHAENNSVSVSRNVSQEYQQRPPLSKSGGARMMDRAARRKAQTHAHAFGDVSLASQPRDQLTAWNLGSLLAGHYVRAAVLAASTLPIVYWVAVGVEERLGWQPKSGLGRISRQSVPKDGVYPLIDTPVNTHYVVQRVVLSLIVNSLSLLILQATYGWRYTRHLLFIMYLPMSAMSICFTFMIYETILGFTEFIAAQLLVWTIGFIIVGGVWLSRETCDKRVRVMIPATFVLYLVVVAIYYFFVPSIFSGAGSEMSRAAIRILLHPVLFEVATLYGRHTVRQLSADVPSPDALWTMVLPIMSLNSLFGRLLMFTMSTLEWTIVTTVLLAALEISMRLTTARRDRLVFRGYDSMIATSERDEEHRRVAQQVVEAAQRRQKAKARGPARRWTVTERPTGGGGGSSSNPGAGSVSGGPAGSALAPSAAGPSLPATSDTPGGSRRTSIGDLSAVQSDDGGRSGTDTLIPATEDGGGPQNASLRYRIAFHTELGKIIGPSMIAVDSISEAASIMTMTAVIWWMRLSLEPGAKLAENPGDLLASAAIQLVTEFATDLVCLAFELKRHGNAHMVAWRERYHYHFFALWSIYFGTTCFFAQAMLSYLCGAKLPDGGFETFYCQ
jgi:hypothetical protein